MFEADQVKTILGPSVGDLDNFSRAAEPISYYPVSPSLSLRG